MSKVAMKKKKTAEEAGVVDVPKAKKLKKSKKKEEVPVNEEVPVTEEAPEVEMAEAVKEVPMKKKNRKKKAEETVSETKSTEVETEEKKKKSKKEKKPKEVEEVKEEVEEVKEEVKEEVLEAKEEEVKEEVEEEVKEKKEDEILEVFIGGLPFEATEEQVRKDFEECGEIVSFRFPMTNGQCKGIAFCEYVNKAGVDKALEFNETEYAGRNIRVRLCQPKGGEKGKGKKGDKGKGKKGKRTEPGEKPDGCKSVIVKQLSYDTTEDTLWEVFGACGEVERVSLLKDKETGVSRGMAFIDFVSTESTDAAVKKCNEKIDNRPVFVDFNAPREKGDGKKGDGKKGKKGKGKKGKGKRDSSFAKNTGSIQEFAGSAQTFSDSD